MKNFSIFAFVAMLFLAVGCNNHSNLKEGLYADIQTNNGNIIVELFYDKTPVTVANFVSLAEGKNQFVSENFKGKPYYNQTTFHRVIKDFMIQGGDPTATGTGSPGYNFSDEIVEGLTFNKVGLLAMANAGANTNGSQFFITQKETEWLNGKHTIFGEVVEGQEVVKNISEVKTNVNDKPEADVVINKINIIRKGEAAKQFDAVKIFTDYMNKITREKEEKEKIVKAQKEQFLTEIKQQKEQAKELSNGVKVFVITDTKGGKKPKDDIHSLVNVNYAGYLTDGTLFDTNVKEIAEKFGKYDINRDRNRGYTSFPMPYSSQAELISGFKIALLSMKIGDKVRVFIPSKEGYGENGIQNVIPANSDLIFDIEIISEAK